MLKRRELLLMIAGSLTPLAFAATAAAAPQDIVVTDAKIEAGKLVIAGKTAVPGTRVRLDGRLEKNFTITSGSDATFRFALVHLPKDCIVSLQKVQGSLAGAATEAVIANCSPSGITPRGPWNDRASYEPLDLVSHVGASWLATRENVKKEPGKGPDWQLFASKGRDGKTPSSKADGKPGSSEADGSSDNPEAAPTGPAGGDLTGTYPNPTIAVGAVTTGKLGTGAVTGGKIKNGSVSTPKIANGAVTGQKIALATITGAHIEANAITAAHIATDAVQATEIADNSIDGGEIIDGSLFAADLGATSVRASELGTITQRSATSANIPGGGNGNVTASCLAGEKIIAGGNDGFFDVVVVASRRNGNGWSVFVHNNSGADRTVTAHAYCLNA